VKFWLPSLRCAATGVRHEAQAEAAHANEDSTSCSKIIIPLVVRKISIELMMLLYCQLFAVDMILFENIIPFFG
jgi:hypothetical protein